MRFTAPLAPGYALVVRQGSIALSGSVNLNSAGTKLTFTGAQPFAKDVDIQVSLTGVRSTNGASAPDTSWSFRTSGDDDVAAPQSMFGDETPVVSAASGDGSSVELGTAFTPSTDGRITAIRFFKGTGNAGTHVGSLWTASAGPARPGHVHERECSGLADGHPVVSGAVKEGNTYVVSYLAPQGRYAYTSGFFAAPWTRAT